MRALTERADDIIFPATFNRVIQTYIFLYVSFILFVTVIGIPLLIVWLLGLGKWYSRHYFEKLECELTRHSLRFKKGILFQVEKTIPLENIQNMTFIEGPLLRHFNLCILEVETAGQGPKTQSEMKLVGINDAPEFRAAVLGQRQFITSQARPQDTGEVINDIRDIKGILMSIERLMKERKEKSGYKSV
jgi:putative membrane protein